MFAALHSRLPRIGRWPRLLLAATCLLLAAGAALQPHGRNARPGRSVRVVVAARDVPAGHVLGRRDLAIAWWPVALRPATSSRDPTSLVRHRTAGPIKRREIITADRLVTAQLVDHLDPGLVAAPLLMDDPHSLDLVRAGNYVDVLEAPRAPEIADSALPKPDVATLVRHALVLAVFPASDRAGAELVLAVDRPTALRITRDSASRVFTAVVVAP